MHINQWGLRSYTFVEIRANIDSELKLFEKCQMQKGPRLISAELNDNINENTT